MAGDSSPSTMDVIGLGVFLAGLVYSPEVAGIVGPYLVIIVAAVLGASFALKRREKTSRLAALGYFLRVAGLAVILTVLLARFGAGQYASLAERSLIAPVALLIGAIGDEWPALLRACVRFIFRTIDLARGKSGGDAP